MKFLLTSLAIVLGLWAVGFYPVLIYLGKDHAYGFFLGSALSLVGNFLSYSAFWFSCKRGADYAGKAMLWGSLIRMSIILAAMGIVHKTAFLNLKIFVFWTLLFYFLFLFYESLYLMKEVENRL